MVIFKNLLNFALLSFAKKCVCDTIYTVMLGSVIIAVLTVITMIITVLFKPYLKIKGHKIGLYYIVCLIGALLMLLTGRISISSAIGGITASTSVNPLKILALFLSMTLLSVFLGDAGFFDFVANFVFIKTKGSKLKLFLVLYAVVSVLTIFTSNDVIILTFTPPICIFAKKAKISPLPFLFGEFIAANTWSMMLIVGNPTNIYLAGSAGIVFAEYFSVMFLPAILGGITGLIALILLFYKDLKTPLENPQPSNDVGRIKVNKVPMIIALVHLVACIIALAISDVLGVEMYLICLISAGSLILIDTVYDLIVYKSISPILHSLEKEPYELIPFVLSMFVIVLTLKEQGVTQLLADFLLLNTPKDGVIFTFLSAISANFLNNIPMSVLFEGIIGGNSALAVYGTVIGSNVGAFMSPVGALAGIMWSKILASYDVKLSFPKFMFFGTTVAIPTLIASTLGLMIML